MHSEQDRAYHLHRARDELDWAYRAERDCAAAAHMRLSALHMRKIKELDERREGSLRI